jgi:hypothetical protein
MLQKYSVQEPGMSDEGGQFLTPAYFIDLLKRRLLWFLIPFVIIAATGATIVTLLPAVYMAEGKILVESQQIPTDLVRPTVSALANERIQVIEQRILTRDNLLTVANKFQLFSGRRKQFSGTDMIDFMRKNMTIKPLDLKSARQGQTGSVTLAFTVGFEHENPATAMKIASEFITMILSEDVRVRTAFAAETTKFLEREVKRLDGELNAIEVKMGDLKRQQVMPSQGPSEILLNALRADLFQKAATFSDNHPEMKAIKQKIAALEKTIVQPKEAELGLEALERQRDALRKNLEGTGQKLTAARLGETLERGQQSERLEIIEQPTMPQKPTKPNRPKFYALALAAAVMAGGGLVFLLEMSQSTIHRSADILRFADSHLVVTIPYISTKSELQRKRKKIVLAVGIAAMTLVAAVIVALALLPPLDVLLNEVFVALGI